MEHEQETSALLREIRDNQVKSMELQQSLVDIARQQFERAETQVAESIDMQREAMEKTRLIGRLIVPLIAIALVLIVYLLVRYF